MLSGALHDISQVVSANGGKEWTGWWRWKIGDVVPDEQDHVEWFAGMRRVAVSTLV